MERKFKVGDRVDTCTIYGLGTIVVIDDDEYFVGVRHDKPNHFLHDLGGVCEDGYGLWYSKDKVKLYNTKENKPSKEIKVTFKGDKTIATEYEASRYVKHAISKPYYTDTPNDKVGILTAITKLIGASEDDLQVVIGNMFTKEVKEVKRPAKVGEYVRVTSNGLMPTDEYDCGDILKIMEIEYPDCANTHYYYKNAPYKYLYEKEYVVLENYDPKNNKK